MPGDQRGFYRPLAAAIRGEAPNPVPPSQALAVTALIETGRQSSAEQRVLAPALIEADKAAFAPARSALT